MIESMTVVVIEGMDMMYARIVRLIAGGDGVIVNVIIVTMFTSITIIGSGGDGSSVGSGGVGRSIQVLMQHSAYIATTCRFAN